MKKFRVNIPASITVVIEARNKASAIRKAKEMESFSLHQTVPGGVIEGFVGEWDIVGGELGKFDSGYDSISSISEVE